MHIGKILTIRFSLSMHLSHNFLLFFFNDTATTEIYTLSLHDALPISVAPCGRLRTLLQRPTQSSVSLVLAPNSLRSISRGQTEPAANLGQHHGCPPVIRCRILRPGQATSAESPVTADAHVPYCVDPD